LRATLRVTVESGLHESIEESRRLHHLGSVCGAHLETTLDHVCERDGQPSMVPHGSRYGWQRGSVQALDAVLAERRAAVAASKRTAPMAHTSVGGPISPPRACSEAMYRWVPMPPRTRWGWRARPRPPT